jgi:ribosomal protein S19E (S16A)
VRKVERLAARGEQMSTDNSNRKSIHVADIANGDDEVAALTAVLGELTSMGLVEQVGDRVHLTPKGRAMLIRVRERLH